MAKETTQEVPEQVAIRVNPNILVTFILALLVLISFWQTIQLSKMTQGVTKTSTSSQSSGSPQVPGTLKDIPSQVGGC